MLGGCDWRMFVVRREAWRRLGPFDPNLYPVLRANPEYEVRRGPEGPEGLEGSGGLEGRKMGRRGVGF